MNTKTAILLAMRLTGQPMSNDDLRRGIGAPAMPQCTITWHLNELSDLGAVESDRKSRYNRWTLTDYGRSMADTACNAAGKTINDKLAARKAPKPTQTMLNNAMRRAPSSVWELALMAAPKDQRIEHDMQLKLWEVMG